MLVHLIEVRPSAQQEHCDFRGGSDMQWCVSTRIFNGYTVHGDLRAPSQAESPETAGPV